MPSIALPVSLRGQLLNTSFDPSRISAGSTAIAWFDPSDLTTMFQDAAGTTPVTTPGQTVALALDKSQGLVLGAELVANGNFSDGLTGWTSGSALSSSVVSGEVQITFGGSAGISTDNWFSQAGDLPSTTAFYKVTFDATWVSGGVLQVSSGYDVQATISANAGKTSYSVVVRRGTAGSVADQQTLVFAGATGAVWKIDNISVRELPGFHATQSTAANRPTYGVVPSRGRVNLATPSTLPASASGMWQSPQNGVAVVGASGPFGTATAATLTANGGIEVRWRGAFTHLVNTQYTWSAYVKRGTARYAYMRSIALGGFLTHDAAWFDITNGVVGSRGVNVSATSIQAAGDGWFRITMTATIPSSIPNQLFDVGLSNGDAVVTSTNGETMLFDAVQIELGSTASPYQRVVSQFEVTDPAGFPSYPLHYLFFGGDLDPRWLQTSTITPNADKVQVFAGVRKLSDAVLGVLLETSTNAGTNNGAIYLGAPATNSTSTYAFLSRGTSNAVKNTSGFAAPITNVLTGLGDISGDLATLRVNGTQVAQSTTDQGTGNYLAYPLFIGRRGGTSLAFNGQLYGLIVRFSTANLDASLINQTERWMAQKTGVTI